MSVAGQHAGLWKPAEARDSDPTEDGENALRSTAESSNRDPFADDQQAQLEQLITLGLGPWYRRDALLRAGLTRGVRVLDISLRPGSAARELAEIVGNVELVRSIHARQLAGAETEPLNPQQQFGLVCIRYALSDANLSEILAETFRLLQPGGRVCILAVSPVSPLRREVLRGFAQYFVPLLLRVGEHSEYASVSRDFWRRYARSISAGPSIEIMEQELSRVGFGGIRRRIDLGTFSQITATRPHVLTARRMDDVLLDNP